ncbi:MAG: hypothetical protein QOG70_3337 [Solirubrobacteraceae bacterium]|nr:hypothetical protein [Solirubrobacteraceae bacterium]
MDVRSSAHASAVRACAVDIVAATVAKQRNPQAEIDWASASVSDGDLTVGLAGDATSDWTDRLEGVIERLQRSGSGWGATKASRKELRVASVAPGSEADLRHFLDSAVLQVNADFAPPEDEGDGDGASEADSEMRAVFRSFADDGETRDEAEPST